MTPLKNRGYMGRLARVDLTLGEITEAVIDEATARRFIGGTGLGLLYLYNEVPKSVGWSDPENRLIVMSGPLGGTIAGTGVYSVVTKGPMTNGAASTQANGFMGAFIKLSGFDGLIVQGAAEEWVYLYIDRGTVIIRDGTHLKGLTTWETEQAIREELGKNQQQLSVATIGPAGENLVRFAAIVSDGGHVAAHNGPGAVMGSKKLKAIAVARGDSKVETADRTSLTRIYKEQVLPKVKNHPLNVFYGTSPAFKKFAEIGLLPVKNYLTADPTPYEKLDGDWYRQRFSMKPTPCWACPLHHCHRVTITDGPHSGFVGDEPEYEGLASCGSLIGNTDPAEAIFLSNHIDWLGMDVNESGWLIAWLMECYEEGLLTDKDMDGLQMGWGNMEAARQMLTKVANREGFGDFLADGVMRAATSIGGDTVDRAVYTKKGNTPRAHDHRIIWNTLLDTAVSSMGTDEVALLLDPAESLGLPPETDRNTARGAALVNAAGARTGKKQLLDSMPICIFPVYGLPVQELLLLLNAATGWRISTDDISKFGLRVHTLLRAFNMKHGHTAEEEEPSARYGSAALRGSAQGKSILPDWKEARETYYEAMGWDRKTGTPLPETLRELELDFVSF